MMYSRRDKICAAAAVLAAGFGVYLGACTPATVDQPAGAAGSPASTAGAGPGTSGGPAGGSPAVGSAGTPSSSAGAPPTGGGSAGTDTVTPGAGAPASGGAPPSGGAGGTMAAAGGTVGMAGAGTAGGATSGAIGCGWAKGADGLWTMNPPAADKQVLYNGADKGLNQWHRLNMPQTPAQWQVIADGSLEVVPQPTPTNIQSNALFEDVCLHVEYRNPNFSPTEPDVQKHGNSGVYLKSAYEMQVLDTSNLGPLIDGCGAVYKVSLPMVVACIMHPAWNVYEIEFKGSVWNTAGMKTKNASFVQVTLNGKLVQMNVTLNPSGGFTEAGIPDAPGPQPVALQDHRENVDYRNIWAAVPHY